MKGIGVKGYHGETPSAPGLQRILHFISCLGSLLIYSVFTVLHRITIFHWSDAWRWSQEAGGAAGVCRKAKDFFCPPKTALRDLLQRSIHGFGWESNRPWPWLSPPKRRTKCWGWQRYCECEPVRADNLYALLLRSCGWKRLPLLSCFNSLIFFLPPLVDPDSHAILLCSPFFSPSMPSSPHLPRRTANGCFAERLP